MPATIRSLCVFCGSAAGSREDYAIAARNLGRLLAERGIRLVYGGGNVGLMGVLADGAIARGGEVIGVIPQSLVDRELAHRGVSELRVVRSMHERKALMADLSDAFIALPGGYGTIEEFCEVLTWAQLGLHRKPFGLLNVKRFYDPFIAQINHAVEMKFIDPASWELLMVDENVDELLARFEKFKPPLVHKWIERGET